MNLKTKAKVKVLGIMNGTSLDAVDYCLMECSQDLKKLKFLKHVQKPIPSALKKELLLAAQNKSRCYQVSLLNFDLGRLYESHAKLLKKSWSWDITGAHGQTIHHEGKKATLQIGHPSFLYKVTGKPVFYDFRALDISAGGQGAPFAPLFQNQLASNLKLKSVAFHNLGGISNLTLIQGKKKVAFDTGPANILMDAWVQKKKNKTYDKNGSWASRGIPDPLLVNQMLDFSYFKKNFPKSTGREEFNLEFIEQYGGLRFKRLDFEDQLATLVEVTALSIGNDYKKLKTLPAQIYFYGGGVYNSYLMERIQFQLPNTQLKLTDDLGWPSQAFEAATFGFLAAARYYGKKVHLPEITGAQKTELLGAAYF